MSGTARDVGLQALLTPAEMGEADRLAIAGGVAGLTLMRTAGRAVADVACRMATYTDRVLILAGPGNNGGDGYVAAEVLRRRGYRIEVLTLGDPNAAAGDAAAARTDMEAAGVHAAPLTGDALARGLEAAGLVIDALFGAGLDRPLSGLALDTVRALRRSGRPVLAVDLPSGLSGETGQVLGDACPAARTVTFFRAKPGHILMPGRDLCGALEVVDIGIPAGVLAQVAPKTWRNAPALWQAAYRAPAAAGHKYARGHAVAVSGGALSTGAARLAAGAALRAGAGLVTVATPPSAALVNAAHLTAVMVRSFKGAQGLAELLGDARLNAVVLGPGVGVGAETRALVAAALEDAGAGAGTGGRTVVLDADALTSFADAPSALFELIGRVPGAVVLTPHEGEFARLFPETAERAGPSKLARARQAASRSGAVVLLKGADTVIAAPDGRAAINANAPAWLATAGSGDVLAGIVTGLAAQGMPAFEAAAMGVWLHGAAGTHAGPALTAEDLEPALKTAIGDLLAETADGLA